MTTHLFGGAGRALCCGHTIWELPTSDQMTIESELVTCKEQERGDYLNLGSEPRYPQVDERQRGLEEVIDSMAKDQSTTREQLMRSITLDELVRWAES